MLQALAENAQERNMKKKFKSLKKGVGSGSFIQRSGSAPKCQGSLTLEWVQGTLVPAVRSRLPMLQAWPTHQVEMGGLLDPDPLVRGSDPDPDPSLFLKK
jgi:hypothetical protein